MATEIFDVCELLDRAKVAYQGNVTSLQSQIFALQSELESNRVSLVPKIQTYGDSLVSENGSDPGLTSSDLIATNKRDDVQSTIQRPVDMAIRREVVPSANEQSRDSNRILESEEENPEEVIIPPAPRRAITTDRILRRLSLWMQENDTPTRMAEELRACRRSAREWIDYRASCIEKIVTSRLFDSFANFVIVLNCVAMGVEANGHAGKPYPAHVLAHLAWCDHIFTLFFTIELGMRVKAFGIKRILPTASENHWNFLDAVLVIFTGVIISWVLPLLALLFDVDTSGETLRLLTVFRVFRLARLFKVVSRVPAFHEAWILIRGLSDSLRTLFWTCFVIFLVTYIFAIFGCSLISSQLCILYDEALDPSTSYLYTESDRALLRELLSHMRGLDRVMYSLIQVLTLDSFHAFTTPLQTLKGLGWSWAYWYAYIAVAVFVLMNLVTAIVVENAMDHAQKDSNRAVEEKEGKWKREIKELEKLFILADVDSSGSLSWEEFKESFDNELIAAKWKLLGFREHECAELFCLLDDGDQEIQTDEFFDGLQRMRGLATAKDVFRLQKCLNHIQEAVIALKTSSTCNPDHTKPDLPLEDAKHAYITM